MSSRIGRGGPDFRGRRGTRSGVLSRIWRGVLGLVAALVVGVVAAAVAYQLSGLWLLLAVLGLAGAAAGLALLWMRGQGGALLLGLLLLLGVAGLWWVTIQPSNAREWAEDVAYGVTADIDGDNVTLQNVRNFDWVTPTEFTPHWETRSYRLSDLRSVDLISSVWASPAIAHTLVSFGFADGRHLVFSAEIWREKGEAFSSFGGLFKRFELVLIAADERDIVRLRTDVRREWVSLYPLDLAPQTRRDLFLSLLGLGNELAQEPRFYNTLTTNCTTMVWRLARVISPELPLDWRVVLSGHLPSYLHELGVLQPDQPLPEVITRARRPLLGPAGDSSEAFSKRLRADPLIGPPGRPE